MTMIEGWSELNQSNALGANRFGWQRAHRASVGCVMAALTQYPALRSFGFSNSGSGSSRSWSGYPTSSVPS